MPFTRKTVKFSFFSILCLGIALLGLGVFLGRSSKRLPLANSYAEVRAGGGIFTNPLLECDAGGETIASQKIDFTPQLMQYVNDLKHSKNVSDISVYYRDLNNGPVMGINQRNTFIPASLLKVPTLIAYLKWSEDNPSALDEKITYSTSTDVGYEQIFPPEKPIQLGQTYTARELLERMVKYSDNQALILLSQHLPEEYPHELFLLLGIDSRLLTDPKAGMNVQQYSSFFRILFNASFLSRTNSEYALKLLSQTTFEDGLVAGVPSRTKVSHKFGERETSGLQQFHDCGVVYYPKHPYLLCVMTKGDDTESLTSSIQDISKFVYTKIDSQYKDK